MCGIAGVIAPAWARDRTEAAVRKMCDAMVHRGPDGSGQTWDAGVGLGMRRLAIVDVANGWQPISNEDDSVFIVFNGEIYNAPALRERLLRAGHRFKTRSDTEVIVHLYEEHDLDFAEEMRGMWAIAIHDRRKGRVVLSRDRVGIKPLFLLDAGPVVAFGSELGAMRTLESEIGSAPFELDPDAAHAFLAWSYIPGTSTLYRHIRRVEPGTHVVVQGSSITSRRYWSLTRDPQAASVESMDEAADLVQTELRRAVREHLEADVPVGAFVSGGIDSGLIAAAAIDNGADLTTFSIGFDVPRFDESIYAREIATTLGTRHRVSVIGTRDLRGAIAPVLAHADEPFGDSSVVAGWVLSRFTTETHKVALSGDGADEIFGGYDKHSIVGLRQSLGWLPRSSVEAANGMLARFPRGSLGRLENLTRRLSRAGGALSVEPATAYSTLTRIASLQDAGRLTRGTTSADRFVREVEAAFEAQRAGDELDKTLAADIAVVLPGDMLNKVDRASMLNSLEVRVPMLDHLLLRLGWSLPNRFKRRGNRGKLVLRELFARRFGPKLANRGKHGFEVPVDQWLRDECDHGLQRLFSRESLSQFGLLSPEALDEAGRCSLALRNPKLLWNAVCLATWCEAARGPSHRDAVEAMLSEGERPRSSSRMRTADSSRGGADSRRNGKHAPKVMVVLSAENVGGTETAMARLLAGIGKHGFDALGTSLRGSDELARLFRDHGVPYRGLGKNGETPSLSEAIAALREERPDVLYLLGGRANAILRPAARVVGTKVVIAGQRGEVTVGAPLAAHLAMLPLVSCTISNSRFAARQLRRITPMASSHVHTIFNGIDPSRLAQQPTWAPLRIEGSPVIVCPARIMENKGHPTLLRATRLLLDEFPKLLLCLVGRDATDGEVKADAEAIGLTSRNVLFAGHRDDVAQFLRAADLVVLASHHEGMPSSLLEAMWIGRPVVATAVGGVPELVRDGETGLLVPVGDPEALAKAMRTVLADPALGRRFGEEGHRIAEAHFTIERMAAEHAMVFRRYLGARS